MKGVHVVTAYDAEIVKYSLLFVSGKIAILSYEVCACCDSLRR